jgi:hypothetical protein
MGVGIVKPLERKSRFWAFVLGSVAFVSGLAGLSTLLAHVVIEMPPPMLGPPHPPPFPARFKVTNQTWYSLYDVSLTRCRLNYVVDGNRNVWDSTSPTGADENGFETYHSGVSNTATLRPDESTVTTCFAPALRVDYADIDVIVSYRPLFPFLWHREKRRRFLGFWHADKTWVWNSVPLNDPVEKVPPATVLPPPPANP